MSITLYHWTHRRNLPSIRSQGLTDRYSRTKDGMLYAVPCPYILTGLKHVADRHHWRPEHMACLAFTFANSRKLGGLKGRFFKFAGTVPPEDIAVIKFYWPAVPITGFCSPGRPRRAPRRKRGRSTDGMRR